MKRRHFIKQSSLAAVGGFLVSQLPLNAASVMFAGQKRHVVLCVVAGLPKSDFEQLFGDSPLQSTSAEGLVYRDLIYGGAAAGHRIALESILAGKYIGEQQTGKLSLAQSPLFVDSCPVSSKYLVTSDRNFLKTQGFNDDGLGAIHLSVSCTGQGENSLMRGSKANFVLSASSDLHAEKASGLRNEIIERNDSYHRRLLFYSEDLLVAETACAIIRNDQPTLLVAHFMGADVAHADISQAETNMGHIGTGIQRVWDAVNNEPEMKDNTLMIVLPDFGRNGFRNSMADENGHLGTDHSVSDENTTHIACLFASNIQGLRFDETLKKEALQSTDIFGIMSQFLGREKHLASTQKDLSEQALL